MASYRPMNVSQDLFPAYLSKRQAQLYSGLSEHMLDAARERGDVAWSRVGTRVLIQRESLDAYLERHLVGTVRDGQLSEEF